MTYFCSIESVLTYCNTVWYASCSAVDKRALQRIVDVAQKIISWLLPFLVDISNYYCYSRTKNILKDSWSRLPLGPRIKETLLQADNFQHMLNIIIFLHAIVCYIFFCIVCVLVHLRSAGPISLCTSQWQEK